MIPINSIKDDLSWHELIVIDRVFQNEIRNNSFSDKAIAEIANQSNIHTKSDIIGVLHRRIMLKIIDCFSADDRIVKSCHKNEEIPKLLAQRHSIKTLTLVKKQVTPHESLIENVLAKKSMPASESNFFMTNIAGAVAAIGVLALIGMRV